MPAIFKKLSSPMAGARQVAKVAQVRGTLPQPISRQPPYQTLLRRQPREPGAKPEGGALLYPRQPKRASSNCSNAYGAKSCAPAWTATARGARRAIAARAGWLLSCLLQKPFRYHRGGGGKNSGELK